MGWYTLPHVITYVVFIDIVKHGVKVTKNRLEGGGGVHSVKVMHRKGRG